MTVDAELVDMLDEKRAKALDKRIRNLVDGAPVSWLVSLNGLIAEAQSGQIHLALGFPSWTAYLADALAGLKHITAECKPELIQHLGSVGMSTRAIATAVGTSKSTVARELSSGVPNGTPDDDAPVAPRRLTVVGSDGKEYPRRPRPVSSQASEPDGRELVKDLRAGLRGLTETRNHREPRQFAQRFNDLAGNAQFIAWISDGSRGRALRRDLDNAIQELQAVRQIVHDAIGNTAK